MNLTSIGDKNNHMQTSICSSEEIPVTLENIANLFDFDEVRCLEFSGTWGPGFQEFSSFVLLVALDSQRIINPQIEALHTFWLNNMFLGSVYGYFLIREKIYFLCTIRSMYVSSIICCFQDFSIDFKHFCTFSHYIHSQYTC